MQPDDLTRIRHMFEAAENAQHFISGKNRTDLDTDGTPLYVWENGKVVAKRP